MSSPHQYGPHDPTGDPATVTVLGPGKYPQKYDVPTPPGILRQRHALNDRAYLVAKARAIQDGVNRTLANMEAAITTDPKDPTCTS